MTIRLVDEIQSPHELRHILIGEINYGNRTIQGRAVCGRARE
jgi:hypothetical protein